VGALVVARRRSRLARAWVALPVILCTTSCGVWSYRSPYAHLASDPEAEVAATDVVLAQGMTAESSPDRGVDIVTRMTTSPNVHLGVASLADATTPPCSGAVVARSDAVRAQWPFVPARAKVAVFTFSGTEVEASGLFRVHDAALDLPIFPADPSLSPRCLRVPLQGLARGTEWRASPYLVGLELRLHFFPKPLPNYDSFAFLIGLPQGIWINGWRLVVSFGGGLVGERGVVATAGALPRAPSVGILGGAFEVGHLLGVRGHLGLDMQFGYDVLGTVAPNPSQRPAEAAAYHHAILHGPRLSLRLLGVPRPPGWQGFAAPPDAWSFGLAAYAGVWCQGTALTAAAPFVGFALEGNLGR
jgi:hypothetical protein